MKSVTFNLYDNQKEELNSIIKDLSAKLKRKVTATEALNLLIADYHNKNFWTRVGKYVSNKGNLIILEDNQTKKHYAYIDGKLIFEVNDEEYAVISKLNSVEFYKVKKKEEK